MGETKSGRKGDIRRRSQKSGGGAWSSQQHLDFHRHQHSLPCGIMIHSDSMVFNQTQITSSSLSPIQKIRYHSFQPISWLFVSQHHGSHIYSNPSVANLLGRVPAHLTILIFYTVHYVLSELILQLNYRTIPRLTAHFPLLLSKQYSQTPHLLLTWTIPSPYLFLILYSQHFDKFTSTLSYLSATLFYFATDTHITTTWPNRVSGYQLFFSRWYYCQNG